MGSFGGLAGGFAKGFQGGYELGLRSREADLNDYRYGEPDPKKVAAENTGFEGGTGIPETSYGTDPGTTGSTAGIAWNDADPTQRAFLNTLAGPESGGEYNIIYGGDHFEDYSKHPGVYKTIESGPNKGKKSSAAGKYQFLESTWNDIASRYGLKDFSPENQDKAAWYLAAETYGRTQGRSLSADLQSNDPNVIAGVGKALAPIWTSLPSGIEQGTTTDKFVSTFNNNLKTAGTKVADAATGETGGSLLDQGTSGKMDQDIVRVAERAARDNPGLFALNPDTKTLRTPEEQADMVKKGWSQTQNSKHLEGTGKAIDLVPINPQTGKPDANYAQGYDAISKAMRKAAQEEGVNDLSWGGDWKSFQDKPHWEVSQLEQQQPSGIIPEEDEEEMPSTLFAAEGGAIPEKDPYFSGRAMTQISDPSTPSTFTPRKVGQAAGTAATSFTPRAVGQTADGSAYNGAWGGTTGGQTASQKKWADQRAAAAAAVQPVAQAAAPVAATNTMTPEMEKVKTKINQMKAQANSSGQSSIGIQRSNAAALRRMEDYYAQLQKEAGWSFAQGGMVKKFAKGGKVKKGELEEQTRRESRGPMKSQHGDQSSSARDAAARRINAARGINSTAIDPDGYWEKPAAPRVKNTPRTRRAAPAGTDPGKTGSTTPTPITPSLPGQKELQGTPPDLKGKPQPITPALPGQKELQGTPPDLVRGSLRVGEPQPGDPSVPAIPEPGSTNPADAVPGGDAQRAPSGPEGMPVPLDKGPDATVVSQGYTDDPSMRPRTAIPGALPPDNTYDPNWAIVPSGKTDPRADPRTGYVPPEEQGPPAPPPAGAEPPNLYDPNWGIVPGPGEGDPKSLFNNPPVQAPTPVGTGAIVGKGAPVSGSGAISGEPGAGGAAGSGKPVIKVGDVLKKLRSIDPQTSIPDPTVPTPEGDQYSPEWTKPVVPEPGMPDKDIARVPPVSGSGRISGTGGPAGKGKPLIKVGDLIQKLMGADPNMSIEEALAAPGKSDRLSGKGDRLTGKGPRLQMAEGGVIPEDPLESDRADAAAYQQPQQQQQQQQRPEPEDRQPTPKLLQDVGQAIKGGVSFLTRTFGLDGGGGAIDTPESQSTRQGGARRLATGEGAASPEEVSGIDDKIDPERRMSEGDRHMERLAKTMQWYLNNGRKEDAEGVAASLMMYGSRRFGQLGSMAAAAYKNYQKTGDKNAYEDAIGYLEKAYDYIPDGGSFDEISIDPETGALMTTRVAPDGSRENAEISADQLPGLLQKVQSGSLYWKEISKLSDPEGSRQKERLAHEDKQSVEKRAQELSDKDAARKLELADRDENRRYQEKEGDRTAQRSADIAEKAALRTEALTRSRPTDKEGKEIDPKAVAPQWNEYWKAYDALQEVDANDDEANKAAQSALNLAGSKLYEAVGGDAKWLKDRGISLGEEGFVPVDTNGAGAGADTPPEPGAQKRKGKDGNMIWVVPDASAPSGWAQVG